MTGCAVGRRTRKTIGMAGQTFQSNMPAGQREISGVVVETAVRIASRVAGEAGCVFIGITAHAIVRTVRFGVFMASGAGEKRVIRSIRMAVQALVPSAFMCAAVNREILPVVLRKIRWRPADISGMAGCAVRRKISGLVVRVFRRLKIGLVASETIGRRICKITCRMAGRTIIYFVTFGQWEKAMVNDLRVPAQIIDVVALRAVGRKPGRRMVGVGRGMEVVEVAVDAVVADAVEAQSRFREVAVGTGCLGMPSQQWEPVVLVQLGDIVHQPVFAAVAAGAIVAEGHLVHVGMAAYTFTFRFRKYQCFVAAPAVRRGMLAFQQKPCFIMVK